MRFEVISFVLLSCFGMNKRKTGREMTAANGNNGRNRNDYKL
jgi:hypothetical protein